jgi:amino acid permease
MSKRKKKKPFTWQGRTKEDIDYYHSFVAYATIIGTIIIVIAVIIKMYNELSN